MVEVTNKTKAEIDLLLVKRVAEKFLRNYKIRNKEVSIALVSNQTIKNLNKTYRQQDRATDVLSFAGEGRFLGEIILDYTQIKKQAKEYGKKVEAELIFVLVHGLLHLVGYDDETEKRRSEMIRLGEEFISQKVKICHPGAKR